MDAPDGPIDVKSGTPVNVNGHLQAVERLRNEARAAVFNALVLRRETEPPRPVETLAGGSWCPHCGEVGRHAAACEHEKHRETEPDSAVWNISVFREDDGRFAADYESGDGREAGMGNYSATPIGALAELCATLIKVAEDKARAEGWHPIATAPKDDEDANE